MPPNYNGPDREPQSLDQIVRHRIEQERNFHSNSKWEVDKKIQPALILVLFGQLAFGVWWTSQLNNRVTSLEQLVPTHNAQIEKLNAQGAITALDIQKLVDHMDSILELTRRQADQMNRLLSRTPPFNTPPDQGPEHLTR